MVRYFLFVIYPTHISQNSDHISRVLLHESTHISSLNSHCHTHIFAQGTTLTTLYPNLINVC